MSERQAGSHGDGPTGDATESHRPGGRAAGERPEPGVPRWVKIFCAVGLLLLVLIVVAVLGGHGPGRHMGGHGAAVGSVAGAVGW